jgi:hypothetical protein
MIDVGDVVIQHAPAASSSRSRISPQRVTITTVTAGTTITTITTIDRHGTPQALRPPAPGRKRHDHAHRPRRIGLRPCHPRQEWDCGSAAGQTQKWAACKFHDVPLNTGVIAILRPQKEDTMEFSDILHAVDDRFSPLSGQR